MTRLRPRSPGGSQVSAADRAPRGLSDIPPAAGYGTRDVALLFGLPARRIRRFVASGILTPGRDARGAFRFSFQDLVLLRAARELVAARVPAKRIHRVLRHLAHQLPIGRPLSGLRITADGDRVLVRDGGVSWNPESGQVQFDFLVSDIAARVAPLARRRAARALEPGREMPAADWYRLGYDLEACAPSQAIDAYGRCLALEPAHTGALVNLGRLLQSASRLPEAEARYRGAMEADPRHAVAAFNLATVLEELNRPKEAVDAYQRALQLDPDLRDAHYNLALLKEQLGDHAGAVRHLRACRLLKER